MYPKCDWWICWGISDPEPTIYPRCSHWFPGHLAPSVLHWRSHHASSAVTELFGHRLDLGERKLDDSNSIGISTSYLALQQVDLLLELIDLLLSIAVVLLQRLKTIHNRLKRVIGLPLPSNSLLEILVLSSTATAQCPQVLVDLLEDWSLLLLLFPPVSFQGIAL